MATLTSVRAKTGFPVAAIGDAGNMKVAYASYTLAANPSAADIIEMCKLPAGAVVLGGWLRATDLDSNATETLDIDIGWKANADEVADPDGFGNLGVSQGDALAEYKPVAGIVIPFQGVLLTAGLKKFTAETVIQLTVNAGAATGGTGVVTVVVEYVVDPAFAVG